MWRAKRLCPELIVVPPNFDRYRSSSKEMFSILREYTDLVEPVSIDEGYMDITDTPHRHRAYETAADIQARLQKSFCSRQASALPRINFSLKWRLT
ncbi:hypothetical protein ACSE3M_01535 [Bacillus velezensis]